MALAYPHIRENNLLDYALGTKNKNPFAHPPAVAYRKGKRCRERL